jgi:hypothetical protein
LPHVQKSRGWIDTKQIGLRDWRCRVTRWFLKGDEWPGIDIDRIWRENGDHYQDGDGSSLDVKCTGSDKDDDVEDVSREPTLDVKCSDTGSENNNVPAEPSLDVKCTRSENRESDPVRGCPTLDVKCSDKRSRINNISRRLTLDVKCTRSENQETGSVPGSPTLDVKSGGRKKKSHTTGTQTRLLSLDVKCESDTVSTTSMPSASPNARLGRCDFCELEDRPLRARRTFPHEARLFDWAPDSPRIWTETRWLCQRHRDQLEEKWGPARIPRAETPPTYSLMETEPREYEDQGRACGKEGVVVV